MECKPDIGAEVEAADGKLLGIVGDWRDGRFLLVSGACGPCWLTQEPIAFIHGHTVVLTCDAEGLWEVAEQPPGYGELVHSAY